MKQFPNDKALQLKPNRELKGENRYLTKGKRLDEGRTIKLKVKCDHSVELLKDYFSNKVGAKDLRTSIRSDIKTILDSDEKKFEFEKFFLVQEGTLDRNVSDPHRVDRILGLYGESFQDDVISKCVFREPVLKGIPKANGDLLRVFATMKNGELEIILIDPHHLVATEKYKELFIQTKHKHKYCISELKKLSKFDF